MTARPPPATPPDASRDPFRDIVVRLCHAFDMRPTLPVIRVERTSPLMLDAFAALAAPRSAPETRACACSRVGFNPSLVYHSADLCASEADIRAWGFAVRPSREEVDRALDEYRERIRYGIPGDVIASRDREDRARAALLSLLGYDHE